MYVPIKGSGITYCLLAMLISFCINADAFPQAASICFWKFKPSSNCTPRYLFCRRITAPSYLMVGSRVSFIPLHEAHWVFPVATLILFYYHITLGPRLFTIED